MVMGVSPNTVDSYIRSSLQLLGVASRVEAARLLAEQELVTSPQRLIPQPSAIEADEETLHPGPSAGTTHETDHATTGLGLAGHQLGGARADTPIDRHISPPPTDDEPFGRWVTQAGALLDAWWRASGNRYHNIGRDGRPGIDGGAYAAVVLIRLSLVLAIAAVLALVVGGSVVGVFAFLNALRDQSHTAR